MSKELKFIHIARTAGNSITLAGLNGKPKQLWGKYGQYQQMHSLIGSVNNNNILRMVQLPLTVEQINKSDWFTVVRNPYEKIVSAYKFLKKQNHRWINYDISDEKELNKDLRNLIERSKIKWEDKTFLNGHFLPQYFYLNPDIKTLHIIKYENLENELNDFFKMKINLPKENSTQHDHYSTYYNKYTSSIIYERYKEDFKKYNYKKI